jgi:hypothetical protein
LTEIIVGGDDTTPENLQRVLSQFEIDFEIVPDDRDDPERSEQQIESEIVQQDQEWGFAPDDVEQEVQEPDQDETTQAGPIMTFYTQERQDLTDLCLVLCVNT